MKKRSKKRNNLNIWSYTISIICIITFYLLFNLFEDKQNDSNNVNNNIYNRDNYGKYIFIQFGKHTSLYRSSFYSNK